jgi:hypothetical protein
MRMHSTWSRPRVGLLSALVACLAIFATPGALAVHGGDREVTVGSNDAVFSQNKQNEPAIAVDANHPNVLAAGANDNIDLEACNAGNPKDCPFTTGVGVSGVQFSFNNGDSWIQPTYSGWTARHCVGPPGFTCTPAVGPIGTLPWYFEEGLVSQGDPAVAFGPRPGPGGTFSWANGSRLYYANLTFNFSAVREEQTFKGASAIGVSRIDGPATTGLTPTIVANKNNWMRPVIASKQSSTTFADKEQIWADNAASSPHFGNVYICYVPFRSNSQGNAFPAPLVVVTSTDGGETWRQKQLTAARTNAQHAGRSGCTIRSDSSGRVYVFAVEFEIGLPAPASHIMMTSDDGGHTWTRPRTILNIVDTCVAFDPVNGRCIQDGIAGARNDLGPAPSVDIANGAPTGADATNLIVNTWADGRDGINNEDVMVSYSQNRGATWTSATRISSAPDRGYYSAPAVSPDGEHVYVVYNAFTTPFRNNTTDPRTLVGVVKRADVVGGAPGPFTEIHRGAPGDPRGSAQNNLIAEFLGDYVYAIATRTYGAAVWNEARNAAVCPAINTYRQAVQSGTATTSTTDPMRPAPNVDCPATFGNTDIFGGSWAHP